jgi:uncharacterized membrane protein YhhN
VLIWAAATGVMLAGCLACEAEKLPSEWRLVFKPLASAGFIGLALSVGAWESAYGRWVLAALVLSAGGDVALMWRTRTWFLAGLVSFLLGHVAYGGAFLARGTDGTHIALAALAAAVAGAAVARAILPKVPEQLRLAVVAYMVVITAMVALAWGTHAVHRDMRIPVAAAAFWASDVSVARDRFTGAGFGNRLWGLPLYYAAQLVFAATAAA